VLLLMSALGFVVAGVFLVARGRSAEVWVGWMCIAFFGAGIPLFARQLFDARPRVVLDEDGVFDRTLGVGTIPWSDIEGAYIKIIHDNPFVCLRLRDADRWTRRLTPTQQRTVSANVKLGFQPLNINLLGTSVDPALVLDIVIKKSAEHA
jgi:hypothetical protein